MKKIVAFILICTICMSSFPYHITVHAEDAFLKAVSNDKLEFLNAIDVTKEFKDGQPLDTPVTRAQFAAIASRLYNFSESNMINDTYYNDVASDYWAANNINYVTQNRLMQGVELGVFAPEESISMNQAVAVLVKVLGYEVIANQTGGYPIGNQMIAARIGLTSNMKYTENAALTREQVIELTHKALHTEVLEIQSYGNRIRYETAKYNTLMYVLFSMYKSYGRVTATELTSLTQAEGAGKGRVAIDNVTYDTSANATDLLGYVVDYYCIENEDNESGSIVFLFPKRGENSVLELSYEDIIDFYQNEYTYQFEESKKTEKAPLVLGNAVIIYNGRKVNQLADSEYIPIVGNVKLIDIGEDELYDIVFITNYEYYTVNTIAATDHIIYDKYGKLPVDASAEEKDKFVSLTAYGKDVAITYYKSGDVLEILTSKDNAFVSVSMVTDKVTGSVTEIGEDTVAIEGKSFKLMNNIDEPIKMRSSGTFYYNDKNMVVAYSKTGADSKQYGFMIETSLEKRGLEHSLHFKILVSDEPEIYTAAEKVRYTEPGTLKVLLLSPEKLYAEMPKTGTVVNRDMIEFGLNEDGLINEIQLPTDMTGVADYPGYATDRFAKDFYSNGTIDGRETRIFRKKVGTKYSPTAQTKVYIVPTAQNANAEDYTVGTISLLGDDRRNAVFSVYGSNEDTIPKALVLYENITSGLNSNYDDVIRSGGFVVDSVSTIILENGDEGYKLTGYQSGAMISRIAKEDARSYDTPRWGYQDIYAKDLKKGDVIQYKTNNKGQISVFLPLLIASNPPNSDATRDVTQSGNDLSSFDALDVMHTIYGEVIIITSYSITLNARADKDPLWNRTYLLNTRPQVTLYESAYDKLSLIKESDIVVGDNVFLRDYYHEIKEMQVIR